MPGLTQLIIDHYFLLSFIQIAPAIACILATWKRGDRRWTLWVNIGCFLASTGWYALVNMALYGPMISLLEGISDHRR